MQHDYKVALIHTPGMKGIAAALNVIRVLSDHISGYIIAAGDRFEDT